MASSLMLRRWKFGLGMFSLYELQFLLWELINLQNLPETPTGFYFDVVVLRIPHSVLLFPPSGSAVGTVTAAPRMYLRILSSVSVGLFHFSSLDQWLGVSHLQVQIKASNSPCDTGDPTPRARGAATSVRMCLCANVRTFHTAISNSGRKDTGAWLRPIQLLYWRQSKESNDTLLLEIIKKCKKCICPFFFVCCCCRRRSHRGRVVSQKTKQK